MPYKGVRNRFRVLRQNACPAAQKRFLTPFRRPGRVLSEEVRAGFRSLRYMIAVLQTVLQTFENGDTYLGVATDHLIESFRNRLWADYKIGAGIEPALLAQFHPLEEALAAMGVVVWPMIELEALI